MFGIRPRLLYAVTMVTAFSAIFTTSKAQIVFTPFVTSPPGAPISISYAGDMFVGSIQTSGLNVLYSTDLNGGNVQPFAPGVNIAPSVSDEHFVASSLGLGGFPNRDVYVAAGNTIVHINHAGTASNTFVSGLSGHVRGILFDAVGSFGHDMLVTTNTGGIYRINSAGVATLITSLGVDTEGLDVAPLGGNFGSLNGQLIVASEGDSHIRAISPTGVVTEVTTVPDGPEELTFVPLNLGASGNPVEGFYGANYSVNVIKAGVDQFLNGSVDYRGDVIVTSEFNHNVYDIHWNGTSFITSAIGAFPNQPEDGIFVTSAIINGGGADVPEPGPLALLVGSVLSALIIWSRIRLRSRKSNTVIQNV